MKLADFRSAPPEVAIAATSVASALLLFAASTQRIGHHDASPAAGVWPFVILVIGISAAGIFVTRPSPIQSALIAAIAMLSFNLLPAVKYTELYDSYDSILFRQFATALVAAGHIPAVNIQFSYFDFPLLEGLTASIASLSGASADAVAKVLLPFGFAALPFVLVGLAEAIGLSHGASRWTALTSLILYKNNFYLFMNLSLAILLGACLLLALAKRETSSRPVAWILIILILVVASVLNHPFTSVALLGFLLFMAIVVRLLPERWTDRNPVGTRTQSSLLIRPITLAAAFAAILFGWWIFQAQGVFSNIINKYLIGTISGATDILVASPVTAGQRHSVVQIIWIAAGYMPGTLILLALGAVGIIFFLRSPPPGVRWRATLLVPILWFVFCMCMLVGYFFLPISVLQWRIIAYALLVSPIFAGLLISRAEDSMPGRHSWLLFVVSVALISAGALEFYTNENWPVGYVGNVVNSEQQHSAMAYAASVQATNRDFLGDTMTGYQLVGYGGLELYPTLFHIGNGGERTFDDVLNGTPLGQVVAPKTTTLVPLYDTYAGRMYTAINDGTRSADQAALIHKIMEEPNVSVVYSNGHSYVAAVRS